MERMAALAEAGYCTDPLPTVEMYFMDAKGSQRTLRGTSQLESRHRYIRKEQPGTNMGVDGAHWHFTLGQFRHLTTTRPLTRSGEYLDYPTCRHDLLHSVNQLACGLGHLGIKRAPFPGITVPHSRIESDDVVGGLKGKPLEQRRLEAAQHAQQQPQQQRSSPCPQRRLEGAHQVQQVQRAQQQQVPQMQQVQVQQVQVQREPLHAAGAAGAAAAAAAAAASPRAQLKRAAAEGVQAAVHLVQSPKRHKAARPAERELSPKGSPSSPRNKFAAGKGKPIKAFHPVDGADPAHVRHFLALLPQFAKDSGRVDYVDLALAWNEQQLRLAQDGEAGTLRPTTGAYLKDFHQVYSKTQGEALTLAPPPRALRSQAQEDAAEPAGSIVATAKNLLGGLLKPFGGLQGAAVPAPGPGRGGPGGEKFCRACAWKLEQLVKLSSAHKTACPNVTEFKQLPQPSQRAVE